MQNIILTPKQFKIRSYKANKRWMLEETKIKRTHHMLYQTNCIAQFLWLPLTEWVELKLPTLNYVHF